MAEPRHALVTGVSSGIGAAVCRRLLREGWQVTGLSRREPEPADGLRWLAADLGRPAGLRDLVRDLPAPHAIVHAAGLQRPGPLGELSEEDGEQMWRVHVQAAMILVDALAPRLPDGSRIVLVGSRTMTGVPGKSQYAATKAALPALARSWAAELVRRRITVNVVAPGPTDTPMLSDPRRAHTPPVQPPLGRLVSADEVAALTAFLLGPEGGAITGQQLVQCAGTSL
jgi:NAD(P)-dependent dehydrogenase (short-subunit alcohol dehydrogenase family)